MRNNVSFYEKRRVVLRETTCRFERNNVSFYEKQRVVLRETTARFLERNGGGMNDTEKCKLKNEKLNCEKTYNIPSRAYVRARIYRSFYFFAVTSVTGLLEKHCLTVCYEWL